MTCILLHLTDSLLGIATYLGSPKMDLLSSLLSLIWHGYHILSNRFVVMYDTMIQWWLNSNGSCCRVCKKLIFYSFIMMINSLISNVFFVSSVYIKSFCTYYLGTYLHYLCTCINCIYCQYFWASGSNCWPLVPKKYMPSL